MIACALSCGAVAVFFRGNPNEILAATVLGAGVEHDHLEPVTECDSLQFLTRYIDFDKILKGEFVLTLSINLGPPSLLTAGELLTKLR